MLYPVEDEKLDTGFFNVSDCEFSLDGMFKCAQRGCVAYVGGTYASGSTDKLLLIDVNLGDSALTSFIPYADFPEFNENRARNFLSTFRKESCTTLYHYEGNYQLEAEGLPEGIILYADDIIPDFAGWDKEEYSLIVKADKLDSIEDELLEKCRNAARAKVHKIPYVPQKRLADANPVKNNPAPPVMKRVELPVRQGLKLRSTELPTASQNSGNAVFGSKRPNLILQARGKPQPAAHRRPASPRTHRIRYDLSACRA
jgi:hypothetical protein